MIFARPHPAQVAGEHILERFGLKNPLAVNRLTHTTARARPQAAIFTNGKKVRVQRQFSIGGCDGSEPGSIPHRDFLVRANPQTALWILCHAIDLAPRQSGSLRQRLEVPASHPP